MRNIKLGILLICQAIVWAAVMIGIRSKGGEDIEGIEHLMIGGWFVTHTLTISLSGSLRPAKFEWACIRRRMAARRAH